jgi:ABC-type glycerol-3-phosphate transport system permease component
MGSVTPPVPPVQGRGAPPVSPPGVAPSRAQQAARASWMAPLVVIIFNFLLKNARLANSSAASLVIAVFSLFLYVAGLSFAVYALSQVRTAGRQGVLVPAIVGLLLNGLFLLIVGGVAVTSFLGARDRASQRQSILQPSVPAGNRGTVA